MPKSMLRSLYIKTPIATQSQYTDAIKPCFFESAGDGLHVWLKLFCAPGGWTQNDIYLLDDTYEPTFRRMRVKSTVEAVNRGYTVTVYNGNAGLFYLVSELSRARPIAVRDYLRVEVESYHAARAIATPISPYTERIGIISKVQPAGSLVGTAGKDLYIQGGFSFEFREGSVR